jgi:hypothetical protein
MIACLNWLGSSATPECYPLLQIVALKSVVYSSLSDNFGPSATAQTMAARSQISAA